MMAEVVIGRAVGYKSAKEEAHVIGGPQSRERSWNLPLRYAGLKFSIFCSLGFHNRQTQSKTMASQGARVPQRIFKNKKPFVPRRPFTLTLTKYWTQTGKVVAIGRNYASLPPPPLFPPSSISR